MEISLGFFVILLLVLFPGLIFRRLYFYGEFSKEFNDGQNIGSLLAKSVVPGLIITILSFIFYSYFFIKLDLAEIIDKFKDINNPEIRLTNPKNTSFNDLILDKICPFIGFQYLLSVMLGTLSGRIIRITKLDTKFKILRYKNYWFYLFNGQYGAFKKLKHLEQKNKKHLFTKADILIDSNSKTHLYSGIIVDYELNETNCCELSKIFLQNAERYSMKNNQKVRVEIPGTLLIVDCSTMININLTHIYQEQKSLLESKLPYSIEVAFGLLIILLIPFFIFKAESVNLDMYSLYFTQAWYKKVLCYFIAIQVFSLLNPFVKSNEEYKYVSVKTFMAKIVLILVFVVVLWLL